MTKGFDLQTCNFAGGHCSAGAQVPPNDRDRMAQSRRAAESELVAFYDPQS